MRLVRKPAQNGKAQEDSGPREQYGDAVAVRLIIASSSRNRSMSGPEVECHSFIPEGNDW